MLLVYVEYINTKFIWRRTETPCAAEEWSFEMYNENNRQMGMAARKNMSPMTRLAPNSGPSLTRDIPELDLRAPVRRNCDGTLRDLNDGMMRPRCDGDRRGDGRCDNDRRGDGRCDNDRRGDCRCDNDRRENGRCGNARCGDDRRENGRCGESRCNESRCGGEPRYSPEGTSCSKCTEGICGGWGLHNYPLAMVYSPCQSWHEVYAPDVALSRGTMFSELDLPFEPSKCRKGCM